MLEILIVELEGGSYGFVFSLGLVGIYVIIFMFGFEDYILLGDDVYGGSFCLLDKVFVVNGLSYMIVNVSDLLIIEVVI